MNISIIIFIIISIIIFTRVYTVKSIDEAMAILIGIVVTGSMIWFTGIWTRFLGFGFIESMARDSRTPQNSSAGIKVLGWLLFLIMAGCTFFI
jgi:hypothetical protein